MATTPALTLGMGLALAACGSRSATPPSPPVIALPAPPVIALASDAGPPAAAAKPKPTTSIVDDEHPHGFDGTRKNPGMAKLRGVSAREAWLDLTVMEKDASYSAIVDLEKGCVVETLGLGPGAVALPAFAERDHEMTALLSEGDAGTVLGTYAALLARFDINQVSTAMVRGHSDGAFAVSDDHRKIAILAGGRIFLSLDGGRRFARADAELSSGASDLHFVKGDRYLTFQTSIVDQPRGRPRTVQVVLDTTAALPAPGARVEVEHYNTLHASTPEGLILFAHESDRCLYGIDPAAPALKQLSCVPGPRIDKNHFFYVTASPSGRFGMEIQGDFQATRGMVFPIDGSAKPRTLKGAHDLHNANVGPDDGGRFAWEAKLDVLRIDAPDGVRDQKMGGTPLGFDTQGRVLVFQQPPLVRPHRPGTMMPPAKGTLEDQKCTLIRRVP
jgi:hypothetical protein